MRNTPLLEASYAGQLNIVKYLLENGYSCNNPKAYGSNGYYIGHVDMVQYLTEDRQMDPNASISKANFYLRTNALHIASQYGHNLIVAYLTTKWIMNASLPDEYGKTALHLAVIHDQFEVVCYLVLTNNCSASIIPQSLLLKNSVIRDFINENKKTKASSPTKALVDSAISSGDLSTVKKLSHKSLQSYSDELERRPIHMAALYGHLHLVKYFIEEKICKPDLKCNDHNTCTPLHLAALNGHVDIVKYLVEEYKCDLLCKLYRDLVKDVDLLGATPLHLAAQMGHLLTVKYILESDYGIDADTETSNGTTPLQFAAVGRNLHVVKYLIEQHKCNPFHRNNDVLSISFLSDYTKHHIKQELERNPGAYDNQGRSTIHNAAMVGSLSIVEYLVSECGVDPNMPSFNDETALHRAALSDHLPVVKYLTQLPNCDIACTDSDFHFTPLHMAALKGNYEVTKYLTQLQVSDAGHRRLDTYGNTPLHLATLRGHFEVVTFFCKEMGISPAIKNHYNETPLHIALKCECAEVALYLIALLYSEYQDSGF